MGWFSSLFDTTSTPSVSSTPPKSVEFEQHAKQIRDFKLDPAPAKKPTAAPKTHAVTVHQSNPLDQLNNADDVAQYFRNQP